MSLWVFRCPLCEDEYLHRSQEKGESISGNRGICVIKGGEVRRLMAKSILNFDFDYLNPAQVKHLAKVGGQTLPGGQARFLNSKCFGSEVSDLRLTRTLSPGVVHLETSWTLLSFQSRPSSWSSWPFPGPHWSVACSLKAHSSETQYAIKWQDI